ncbi:pseudouridine synthase [Stigmatella sp. ncwal1]|uniref:Pseudouridine synthase n=1 Tax=Stigmatella ashevillensis TaxID=2995309 RepID=A0ABT5DLX1_9BACT|nr:pseudouridine synthase [Stigmatella ashevillena]MDC0714140.1 pseudouridine synthase [Stigmatella ashevillena]
MRRKKTPRWLQAARVRGGPVEEAGRADWLARALGRSGIMPQQAAEQAIREGRVKVEGRLEREPFAPVRLGATVFVDGWAYRLEAPLHVLMFHKPEGVIVAGTDPEGQGTVFERLRAVLPPDMRNFEWYAVGRLDRDTTGLLLFTNDERVFQHGTSPEKHLPKRYVAQVAGNLSEETLARLREGMVLEDGPTRPAGARLLAPECVELVLTEGRHHQVKRMLAAVGHPVLALHRQAVGSVALDVPVGDWRSLSPGEVTAGLGFQAS